MLGPEGFGARIDHVAAVANFALTHNAYPHQR
jgi:hypothetical protein